MGRKEKPRQRFGSIQELHKRGYILEEEIKPTRIKHLWYDLLPLYNISIIDLSRETGIHRQRLYKCLQSETQISLDAALRIAAYLKRPVEELFKLEGNVCDRCFESGDPMYLYIPHLEIVPGRIKAKMIKNGCLSSDFKPLYKISERMNFCQLPIT